MTAIGVIRRSLMPDETSCNSGPNRPRLLALHHALHHGGGCGWMQVLVQLHTACLIGFQVEGSQSGDSTMHSATCCGQDDGGPLQRGGIHHGLSGCVAFAGADARLNFGVGSGECQDRNLRPYPVGAPGCATGTEHAVRSPLVFAICMNCATNPTPPRRQEGLPRPLLGPHSVVPIGGWGSQKS